MTDRNRQPKRELSDAERERNRKANLASRSKSTGPRTEEGKAISSRNAWKHGRYSALNLQYLQATAKPLAMEFGKPCRTTCAFHPDNPDRTEAPCSLVLDGLTKAGSDCLDRSVFVMAADALLRAMNDDDMDGMHGLMAAEIAANIHVIHLLREEIAKQGVTVKKHQADKNGNLICDKDGEPVVFDVKINSAVLALGDLMGKLGISVPEALATPKARDSAKTGQSNSDALQTFLGGIAGGGLADRMRQQREAITAPKGDN